MRKVLLYCGLGLMVALFAGCSREEVPTAPDPTALVSQEQMLDHETVAEALVQAAGWEIDPDADRPDRPDRPVGGADKSLGCWIIDKGRDTLPGNIAHYWWEIPCGNGPGEAVRLHRVVKERRPYRPIRTEKNVFAMDGGAHFAYFFLPGVLSSTAPDDWGMAHYLAENNVDVWGIDMPWALVPEDCTDFSFMADWDLQFAVDRARSGMAVARFTRLLTGSGWGQMTLLGFGRGGGGMTGYAVLNLESQLPSWRRLVDGYIPIEVGFKTDSEIWRQFECGRAEERAAALEAGNFAYTRNQGFQVMALLYLTDPDGESPFVPGLTNEEAALFFSAMTWVPVGFPDLVHYHAGVYGENGMPVDLQHVSLQGMAEVITNICPFNSMRFAYETAALLCDETDSPHDDHLADITVPVFAVGAGGGFGPIMDYTTTLLGSSDVTTLLVQTAGEMILDYGHMDLVWGDTAEVLAWQPILGWIQAHSDREEVESSPVTASVGP